MAAAKRPRPDESPDPQTDRPQKQLQQQDVARFTETVPSISGGKRAPDTTTAPSTDMGEAGATLPVKASRFKLRMEGSTPDVPENELDPARFPSTGMVHMEDWNPLDEKVRGAEGRPKEFLLEDFSFLKNQTLVFKVLLVCLFVCGMHDRRESCHSYGNNVAAIVINADYHSFFFPRVCPQHRARRKHHTSSRPRRTPRPCSGAQLARGAPAL
jgi:hypothetical protein